MNQYDFYNLIDRHGFTASDFSDHSNFFSSWSLSIKNGTRKLMIEHDERDNWLIFYKENESNKLQEIDRKKSHNMNDSEILKQCESWLLSI